MSIKVGGGGGGGGGPATAGKELAYAQLTTGFSPANADDTPIPGLSIDVTVPTAQKYALEFYCRQVDENSGSTAGDFVSIGIEDGNGRLYTAGIVVQGPGGVGSALYIRSGTLVGDSTPLTFTANVANLTNTLSGAILHADGGFPMYLRAVALS